MKTGWHVKASWNFLSRQQHCVHSRASVTAFLCRYFMSQSGEFFKIRPGKPSGVVLSVD